MSALDLTPVMSKTVAFYTSRDIMLLQVCQWILQGWPSKGSPDFQPYTTRKDELSEQLGCVWWGSQLVILAKCQDSLLNELHMGNLGISQMKSFARCHIWCPKLDADIELCVRSCAKIMQVCLRLAHYIHGNGLEVHVDYAGMIKGK